MSALEIIKLIKNQGYQFYTNGVCIKQNVIIEINRGDIKIIKDTIKIKIITEGRSVKENLTHLEATIKFIEGIE